MFLRRVLGPQALCLRRLELNLRSRMERELTNHVDQLAKLFKCNLSSFSPSEIDF